MSSILSSQGVVLATAMAVSGTLLFLTLRREKNFPQTQFSGNPDSQPTKQTPRSCLYSDEKKRERKKKRVKFADSVKDQTGNGEEFRKERKKSWEIHTSCRREVSKIDGMPANRVALYNGILRERVQRTECSY
ncbi:hypothetical protein F0562_023063 [Nyssa sinensis]|uniref:Uncharacterized protein n=1 Tax=Nyssa sinensis TaxID=561372 RepID=A0A5J5BL92_9ASTE|nr:hypothetical protein F0562_023063 [Nyssa sinensis]